MLMNLLRGFEPVLSEVWLSNLAAWGFFCAASDPAW